MTGTQIHVDAEATGHYTPESPLVFAYNQLMDGILPAVSERQSYILPARTLGLSYEAAFTLRLCAYWDGVSYEGGNSIYRLTGLGEQLFDAQLRELLCKLLD